MKNYFKKFSIMFVMVLMLVLGWSISAFAADDGVVGTSNLNNAAENSAKVGNVLKLPEVGWKRYDDTNKNIKYDGTLWTTVGYSDNYTGATHVVYRTTNSNINSSYKFNFSGTKLRILTDYNIDHSNSEKIIIDGKVCNNSPYSTYSSRLSRCVIGFEITGLAEGIHSVVVTNQTLDVMTLDAVDIGSNEQLLPYNESITLDKSTMNLIEGDSGQLTAITTPSSVGVTWTVSDPSIATIEVDPTNGKLIKVNGIKEGTCTITATTADGSNLSASCIINVTRKTEPTPYPQPTDTDYITNIAHAKGTNTNNPGGEVTIIFHGTADTILSIVKTADVKDVWIGDNFTYTLVITNTGTKTAKAVAVNDPAPNHINFNVSGVTTTQGKVDSSSSSKNIIVNVGDILPGETVTIKIPSTVIA
ncbi:putative repeat protein (TIGR01451 family) [Clostridium saccharoperbutylacetonicum]|uniref:BIG2 domain-containing protein n=1 Tax=Clostridium saccharoperbutylacetonicum N1-4(HMT) TaxID=931276 RepID=M1M1R6_9CLOT|nr:Ig-like domain-containing protein [Clostridium saccharoperbutylacetonicum]AGF59565.1 hypothetical protein Cspa_135p00050 [Clostridium saccharoperbutylacetonicum N1-4(HMT)]NRT64579.1 putative repeat protein (TIGR01451 family) [Clostridium saccharoperbutylacetonicum]NSB28947.1 putative repeat protein (TIGR01451 family) [Clostridium saccharoperbutylacetonicum]NSB46161.1 putative repeat protein (TIGR01451 family) [Clostridium saccharoperbutylacetonicum]